MTAQESQNTGAENSTDKEATPQELADHGGYDSMSDIANDKLAWQAWDWINENRDIRFVPDGGGEFYSYNDGVWKPDGERKLSETTVKLLKDMFKPHVLNNVKAFAQNLSTVEPDQLGVANGKIPFQNGILDLETREFRGIEKEDYVIQPIPHEYDPEISYRGTTFRGFIRDVVPNEEQRKTLQEFTGYLLVRGELPYQKAMMLVGEPAAGKGSFLRIIRKMLGDDNMMAASLQQLAGNQFSAYRLENKLANIYPDLSGKKLDASEVKTLTGDDMREVDRKYHDPKDIRVTTKMMFAMNETPPLENDDDAFYRRLLFAEFPNRHTDNPNDEFPDIDQSIEETIKENEIQAVINWALDGYDRLSDQGRFTGTIASCPL